MAGAWRGGTFKDSGLAVHVEGLAELQRAFRRIGGELPKDLRRALREMAEPIREKALANLSHKTGRTSKDGPIALKVGVTARAVSVYSNTVYSKVQDQGGRVGRNHATLLTRASVSGYMTRAVQESGPVIEAGLSELGDNIARLYEQ